MDRLCVFDFETVPDLAAARRLLDPAGALDDAALREALDARYARAGAAPGSAFVKAPLHRVVCIGLLMVERDDPEGPFRPARFSVRHTGDMPEAELLRRFIAGLRERPVLVGFNTRGFDLPVLRWRCMALGLPAPAVFQGDHYTRRYSPRHLDLCDLLADFGASPRPSLAEAAAVVGASAKPEGMDGLQVEGRVAAGDWAGIAAYCGSDVLALYRVFLAWAVACGGLSAADAETSAELLHDLPEANDPPLAALLGREG
ncbi:hypothetical protein C8P66_11259 [Humitalea rosea]|uniref:Predicted 3'-5' exonuclease PolB-like domain-containing protein n=1 Tax=Humitalea rosea TaxID=990373 RepID=A0A2W7KBP4_9PROT|nr:3'-5' exonuclease [Humitalea rosea]PZW45044.1 hypothetical protein C8P66_11259 [Humitalea rosea]